MGSLSWQRLFSQRYPFSTVHGLHSAAAVHVTPSVVPPEPAGPLCIRGPIGGARVPCERSTVASSGLVQR